MSVLLVQNGLHVTPNEYHTVGGFLMKGLNHVPRKGDSVIELDLKFTAEECDDRMALKVRIERDGPE
ncbi:MAG TPA: transporter associated domain-containing protein [Xanthomonadales bacterium]|nr:transporter associated domain-containing protein [Xanthomonadales bacterium]